MKKATSALFALLLLCAALFAACSPNVPQSSKAAYSDDFASHWDDPDAFSAPESGAANESEYQPMTPELYENRRNSRYHLAWFTGEITSVEVKEDSYGTLYSHLSVLSADSYEEEYKLLYNYTAAPFQFTQGERYTFYVDLAAARGALIQKADPA